MKRYFIIILVFSFSGLMGQNQIADSIMSFDIGEVVVFEDYNFLNSKEEKKYKVLEEDLNVIYPLLVIVRNDYTRINKELELYSGDKEKEFLKWYENYAKKTYIHHLGKLNVRQGRLFLIMISRELEATPYDVIKKYRNGFKATLWQIAANFYFANLKTEYSPKFNPMIEHIMKKLETQYS